MTLPKKPLSSANRQPQGIPVGGQFAATTHSEPDVTLSAEKASFTEADNDPNLALSIDADTGDDPTHDSFAEGSGNGGNGGLPPGSGGSGDDDEEKQRKAHEKYLTDAGKSLLRGYDHAKTVSVSVNNHGNLRIDDVKGPTGESIEGAADSLNFNMNANVPGGRAVPASYIIGNRASATIQAQALIMGKIEFV